MRKLAFLSLLTSLICTMPLQSFAAAKCNSATTLSFSGNQDPDDDEFLYASASQFNAAQSGYENTGHKNSGSGKGYECDEVNSGSCGCNAVIELQAGHVFKGETINRKRSYQCICGLDDYWKVVNNGTCNAAQFGEIEVGHWFLRELTKEECSGYDLTDENGVKFRLLCREGPSLICKATECKPGYKLNSSTGKCTQDNNSPAACPEKYKDAYVPCWQSQTNMGAKTCYRKCHADKNGATTMIVECNPGYTLSNENTGWKTHDGKRLYSACIKSGSPAPNPTPSPNPTTPTVSCRDGRTTLNGKACCDTGTLGTYNQSSDTCTCKNDLEFVIENGTGYCRSKSGTPTFTCPATQLTWVANLKISCGTNTEIQSKIEMIETYCRGTGVSETAFNEYIAQLMELSAKLCGGASDEQKICDKISDAHMIGDTCTCDDKNKELNRTTQRCEESAAAIAEREQAESKARITSITGKLNS
ncbi:MAG: hypothetical protein K2L25_03380, partial [Alphaproteobacteria bacterium]|nr:hypothetical protein [Alphaproteobacteria bacterium]